MLLGYVSDEYYVAVPNAAFEVIIGDDSCITGNTTASGAIHIEATPGEMTIIVNTTGFAPKRVRAQVDGVNPLNIRLISDRLYGFVWPKWVQAGESAEVLVSSKTPYSAELWSYNSTKEKIANLGFDSHPIGSTLQNTGNGDYVSEGVDWKDGIRFQTPGESGLYVVRVKNQSGEEITFPVVVYPKSPKAKVAILTSSITWNAYNNFGGRSNYVLASGLPNKPLLSRRLDLPRYQDEFSGEHDSWSTRDYPALSFKRPEPANQLPLDENIHDDIPSRDACGLADAEWRTLGWLESKKIEFDLYSEVQLHIDEIPLDSYKVLVLNCHPEYWSRKMFDTLKNWVFQKGGRLIYLGGNGINCEVRFNEEGAVIIENGDYSQYFENGVFRCFCQMPCDDQYRSRFTTSYMPESSLLGISYTRSGLMTGAPYKVVDGNHWVFQGTGLKEGDLFGEKSSHTRCPGGASGHELDKRDKDSPQEAILLAKGTNPDDSGAEMVTFQTSTGGWVFSVGSINYPCSLNVDEYTSQITLNVFKRFLEE